MTKASVCIPTYNGARYLSDCLESVLAQTLEDIEIICVDDCSADGTLDVLNSYALRDSRIRVFSNELNLGLVENWNRCIKLVRTDWIKFVFQDDIIFPNCLEQMLSQSTDCPFVVCRRNFIFEDGTNVNLKDWYKQLPDLHTLFPRKHWISPEEVCEATLNAVGRNFFGEPTSALLHRSVFDRFGTFNPNLVMMCDTEYWTRVAIHTGVVCVPEVLAQFRVHAGATSAANRSVRRYRADILDQLALLHDFTLSESYQPLQHFARTHIPPIDLKGRLSKAAKAARAVAVDAAGTPQDPNGGQFAEWSAHLARYPQLREFLRPGFGDIFPLTKRHARNAVRLIRSQYDRHVGWRFK